MKLALPPPVVALMALLAMRALRIYMPGGWYWEGQRYLAVGLIVFATIVGAPAIFQFIRAKTTVHPRHPEQATTLVTGGIFRLSRNPMYLGLVCVLLAVAVTSRQPLNLLIVALFVIYMTQFQIKPEEEALQAKFGDAYRDYCSRVRRWI